MASGQNAKKRRTSAPVVTRGQGLPWITIGAVIGVPTLAGGIFWVVEGKTSEKGAAQDALAPWIPSESKPDPSTAIPGIYVGSSTPPTATTPATYPKDKAADHVSANQRVAQDRYPPVGGPHDVTLASCNGVDYTKAVRNENMAHCLEHGAVWIAYSPDTVTPADLPALTGVQNQPYMSLSPYPGWTPPCRCRHGRTNSKSTRPPTRGSRSS